MIRYFNPVISTSDEIALSEPSLQKDNSNLNDFSSDDDFTVQVEKR